MQTNWLQQRGRCLLFENRPVTKLFIVSHKVDKFKCDTVTVPCCERSECCWCASTCARSSFCIHFNRQRMLNDHTRFRIWAIAFSLNTHWMLECLSAFRIAVMVIPILFCVRITHDRDSNIWIQTKEKVRCTVRYHLTWCCR